MGDIAKGILKWVLSVMIKLKFYTICLILLSLHWIVAILELNDKF